MSNGERALLHAAAELASEIEPRDDAARIGAVPAV